MTIGLGDLTVVSRKDGARWVKLGSSSSMRELADALDQDLLPGDDPAERTGLLLTGRELNPQDLRRCRDAIRQTRRERLAKRAKGAGGPA